jgi:hypothetical protein
MIDLVEVVKIWRSDRLKNVMLPGLGSQTCGEAAEAMMHLLAEHPAVHVTKPLRRALYLEIPQSNTNIEAKTDDPS